MRLMVHSHLRFSQLLREPELIVEQWVTLYYMGTFTPVIWSTIAWTEKFNNGLYTHFLRLRGLKSSRNSSHLNNRRCELSLMHMSICLTQHRLDNRSTILKRKKETESWICPL